MVCIDTFIFSMFDARLCRREWGPCFFCRQSLIFAALIYFATIEWMVVLFMGCPRLDDSADTMISQVSVAGLPFLR